MSRKVRRETSFHARMFTDSGLFPKGIEGPAYDADGSIYLVNFARLGTIGRVSSDGSVSLFAVLPSGSTGSGIRFGRNGAMYIADWTGHCILRIDPGSTSPLTHVHESRMFQPNDIAIDEDDTLYVSDPDWPNNAGQLWQVGADRIPVLIESGLGTANGIEVDTRRRILYVNETVQRRIWAYDLATSTGRPVNKRLLVEFDEHGLDGMSCDVDGDLFVTRPDGGIVTQVDSQGAIVRDIPLPGIRPTNLTFGGADGRDCFVTLADRGGLATFRVARPGLDWQHACSRSPRPETSS